MIKTILQKCFIDNSGKSVDVKLVENHATGFYCLICNEAQHVVDFYFTRKHIGVAVNNITRELAIKVYDEYIRKLN